MKHTLTFRTLAKRAVINNKTYELYKFVTWIESYHTGYTKADLPNITITNKRGIFYNQREDTNGELWTELDQDEYIKWVACCDGEVLNDVPTYYYDVHQIVSKHANLRDPKMVSGYAYCYDKFTNLVSKNYESYKGEYIPNYDDFFTPRYKIGDRIFYAVHKDSDTRCGERHQVESFIIKGLSICGGNVTYHNYEGDKSMLNTWDIQCRERRCYLSVEELAKHTPEKLYMWHRNGRCCIEPCTSTELYLKYNA